jgi:hypothetical protein
VWGQLESQVDEKSGVLQVENQIVVTEMDLICCGDVFNLYSVSYRKHMEMKGDWL